MYTGDILQLQFGHYSNFIGAHFWNIQEATFDYKNPNEEINHDCIYREGQTDKGYVTYTPKCLLVDLKGSLKTLPERGTIYNDADTREDSGVCWNGEVTEIKQPNPSKNQLQMDLDNSDNIHSQKYNLEKDVDVWSDFLYTRFHPRTVNIINEYTHNSTTEFDVYPLGTKLWGTEQFQEDFTDKIRQYAEDADSFQGFNILMDIENGFGGLASSCIEHLRDEYEKQSVLVFPVIPSNYADYAFQNEEEGQKSLVKDSVRVLNFMLSLNSLVSLSSLFVPLCTSYNGWRQPGPKREFHHLSYDHTLPYHTSAILASAIDTLTLKQRLKGSHYSLSDLCADLNGYGRKASAASICLPFSINNNVDFIDCLNNWEGPLTQSITPNCALDTDKTMQLFTIRGISEDRLKRATQHAGKQNEMEAYKCNSVQEMLSFYLSCNYFLCANNVTSIKKPLPVKTPYPHIFDERVGVNGNIIAINRPDNLRVESVPVLAGLHSTSKIGDMFTSLHTEAKKIKFRRFHQFTSAGLEEEDFCSSLDGILNLRDCYIESDYI